MALNVGNTNATASYEAVSNYAQAAGIGNVTVSPAAIADFGPTAAAIAATPPGDLLATPASGGGSDAWVFITAPGTVSYTQQAEVTRLDIFGTNTPPVVVGAKGMRDLTLSDALMEGFTLGRSVQPHIDKLEQMMDVSINTEAGFVNVPVYSVKAGPMGGGKDYGYYVISQIEIDEQMRDLKGNATRAMVGVSLKQVPKYQVGTGLDQAGASTGGGTLDPAKFTNQAGSQDAKVAASQTSTPAKK